MHRNRKMPRFFQKIITFWALVRIWLINQNLKHIVRREKAITALSYNLNQRRRRLLDHQHSLTNKYNLRPSDHNYRTWLLAMSRIATVEYNFSPELVHDLDDGTYQMYYFRGYRPEHAMLEIYGPPLTKLR